VNRGHRTLTRLRLRVSRVIASVLSLLSIPYGTPVRGHPTQNQATSLSPTSSHGDVKKGAAAAPTRTMDIAPAGRG
jgi:hypothetical protein